MNSSAIQRIAVLGAGSAGLLAAIALKRRLPGVEVRVVRSADIGVIGVGEGTTDMFPRVVFGTLGLHPKRFYEEAEPQWKLGLRFLWGKRPYFDFTFSNALNDRVPGLPRNNGFYAGEGPTDIMTALMDAGRVLPSVNAGQPLFFGQLRHGHIAFHIENLKLVAYLEACCGDLGVKFQDAMVTGVERGAQGIAALVTESGERIAADLFVDASGFRSELVGRALEEPFVSYKDALFCDRAVIGGWERTSEPILPYTTCETMDAGWCWQIEHAHFINRGYVYSGAHIADEEARAELLRKNPRIPAERTRVVKFRSGRYRNSWVGNVVAVGNAGGFVEPLEATALAVILGQVVSLANCLEDCELCPTQTQRDVANRYWNQVWDDIRDFLAVHYKFNMRLDTPFWQQCRAETALGGAGAIVDYYRENGPSGFGHTVLLDKNNPNGWEAYVALLLGQDVPYARQRKPTAAELEVWQRTVAGLRSVAGQGLAPRELSAAIRRPDFDWNKTTWLPDAREITLRCSGAGAPRQ